jgi:hypothetical protein
MKDNNFTVQRSSPMTEVVGAALILWADAPLLGQSKKPCGEGAGTS